MPVNEHYVAAVIRQFHLLRNLMGALPMPDEVTLVAAEILKGHLPPAAYPKAVEVVQVRAGAGLTVFVVAFSGSPYTVGQAVTALQAGPIQAAQQALEDALGSGHLYLLSENDPLRHHHAFGPWPERYIEDSFPPTGPGDRGINGPLVEHLRNQFAAALWRPLFDRWGREAHVNRGALLDQLGGFLAQGRPATDVTNVFQGKDIGEVMRLRGRTPDAVVTRKLIACALAVRQNRIELATAMQVILQLQEFIQWLDSMGQRALLGPWSRVLAANLRALMDGRGTPGGEPIPGLAPSLATIWQNVDEGQYCAEPRAFFELREGEPTVRGGDMVSQVAFWWAPAGSANPCFVIGPEANPGSTGDGSYMHPCASCATRSEVMTHGIARV